MLSIKDTVSGGIIFIYSCILRMEMINGPAKRTEGGNGVHPLPDESDVIARGRAGHGPSLAGPQDSSGGSGELEAPVARALLQVGHVESLLAGPDLLE